jgi:hypothetical protein
MEACRDRLSGHTVRPKAVVDTDAIVSLGKMADGVALWRMEIRRHVARHKRETDCMRCTASTALSRSAAECPGRACERD